MGVEGQKKWPLLDLCSPLIISAWGSQLKATFGTRKPPTKLLVVKLHYG